MNKREMRLLARQRLRSIGPEQRRSAGEKIAQEVWRLPELEKARMLLLYAATSQEVPTESIAHEARRRGMVVAYPRCIPESREMVLHRVRTADDFEEGAYGLLEPRESCPVIPSDEVEVALIPGLAWDRHGGRLGRGAGYYDRLLAGPNWRGFRCGLFYAGQELPRVCMDPWDVPLQAVVTEREVLGIGGARPDEA